MDDLAITLDHFDVAESALMSEEVEWGDERDEHARHASDSAQAAASLATEAQAAADDARLAVLEAVLAALRVASELASPYVQHTIQHSTTTSTAAYQAAIQAEHAARCADPRYGVIADNGANDAYQQTCQQAALAARSALDAAAARDRFLAILDRGAALSADAEPVPSEPRQGKRAHGSSTPRAPNSRTGRPRSPTSDNALPPLPSTDAAAGAAQAPGDPWEYERPHDPRCPPNWAVMLGLKFPVLSDYVKRHVFPLAERTTFWRLFGIIKLSVANMKGRTTWPVRVARDFGAGNAAAVLLLVGPEHALLEKLFTQGFLTVDEFKELCAIQGAIWQGPDDPLWDPYSGVYGDVLLERVDDVYIYRGSYWGITRYMARRAGQHLERGKGHVIGFCGDIMGITFTQPPGWHDGFDPTQPSARDEDEFEAELIEDHETTHTPLRTWADLDIPINFKPIFVRSIALQRIQLEGILAIHVPEWVDEIGQAVGGLLRWAELDRMISQGVRSASGWRVWCQAFGIPIPHAAKHENYNSVLSIAEPDRIKEVLRQ